MRRIEVGSDGFENFVIDESVVDVALKIVGFVWDDLVGVSDESNLSFIEWENFLVAR